MDFSRAPTCRFYSRPATPPSAVWLCCRPQARWSIYTQGKHGFQASKQLLRCSCQVPSTSGKGFQYQPWVFCLLPPFTMLISLWTYEEVMFLNRTTWSNSFKTPFKVTISVCIQVSMEALLRTHWVFTISTMCFNLFYGFKAIFSDPIMAGILAISRLPACEPAAEEEDSQWKVLKRKDILNIPTDKPHTHTNTATHSNTINMVLQHCTCTALIMSSIYSLSESRQICPALKLWLTASVLRKQFAAQTCL